MGTQHSSPDSMVCVDADAKVTKDDQLIRHRHSSQENVQVLVSLSSLMASSQQPVQPDVYLSGACISGLTTSVFADPVYHEGLLIGESNGTEREKINIYGMLPFRIFGQENVQKLTEKLEGLDFRNNILGVYRCREKMGDHQISVNDFLAINHFNARLFCLIEKSSGDYSMVEQTLYRCEKANGRWSIRKIPFGVWSLANHRQTGSVDCRRMHEGPDLDISTEYMYTLLEATKSMIQGANEKLKAKSEQLAESMARWQPKNQDSQRISLYEYLSNAPGETIQASNEHGSLTSGHQYAQASYAHALQKPLLYSRTNEFCLGVFLPRSFYALHRTAAAFVL
nr:unnamed protein product [Spirometra erinaceieuropaei]